MSDNNKKADYDKYRFRPLTQQRPQGSLTTMITAAEPDNGGTIDQVSIQKPESDPVEQIGGVTDDQNRTDKKEQTTSSVTATDSASHNAAQPETQNDESLDFLKAYKDQQVQTEKKQTAGSTQDAGNTQSDKEDSDSAEPEDDFPSEADSDLNPPAAETQPAAAAVGTDSQSEQTSTESQQENSSGDSGDENNSNQEQQNQGESDNTEAEIPPQAEEQVNQGAENKTSSEANHPPAQKPQEQEQTQTDHQEQANNTEPSPARSTENETETDSQGTEQAAESSQMPEREENQEEQQTGVTTEGNKFSEQEEVSAAAGSAALAAEQEHTDSQSTETPPADSFPFASPSTRDTKSSGNENSLKSGSEGEQALTSGVEPTAVTGLSFAVPQHNSEPVITEGEHESMTLSGEATIITNNPTSRTDGSKVGPMPAATNQMSNAVYTKSNAQSGDLTLQSTVPASYDLASDEDKEQLASEDNEAISEDANTQAAGSVELAASKKGVLQRLLVHFMPLNSEDRKKRRSADKKKRQTEFKAVTGKLKLGKPDKRQDLQSVYADNVQVYLSNYNKLVMVNTWLKVIIIFAFIMLFAAFTFAVITASRSQYIPYVMTVDNHGLAVGTGIAKPVTTADERIVTSTLSAFLQNLRRVSLDVPYLNECINSVYAHLREKGDPARQKVTEWYTGENSETDGLRPDQRAETTLVTVKIVSLLHVTNNSVQIDWIETTYNHDGTKVHPDVPMRGIFHYVIATPPTDLEAIIRNPFGIYVTDFSWSVVK